MWVRPELQSRWTPRLTGWLAHREPFGFAPRLERRDDAWRFLTGTPNVSALYAARPGLEIVNEIGVAAIRAKSEHQTARLLALATQRGWRCTTPPDPARRGGTVAIDLPDGYPVSRALKAREVLCDYRPGAGVRLSPHFYTLDDELDAAVATLEDILATQAWRRFAGDRRTVT
jgi:kynureninase